MRFDRISHGTAGSAGTYFSYTMKSAMTMIPIISGARTCPDTHGKRMPPNVRPTIASVEPAIIMRLPLVISR